MWRLWVVIVCSLALNFGCSDGPDPGDDTSTPDTAAADTASPDAGDTVSDGTVDATDGSDTLDASDVPETSDGSDVADATGELTWESCHGKYQCTDIEVPLDYSAPDGEQITLRVLRKTAAEPPNRIGTVMAHFGGPGISGISLAVDEVLPILPVALATVHNRFDFVVVEPRGAAANPDPVDCVDGETLDSMRELDATPDDDADWNALTSAWQSYVEGCNETHSTEYLASLNSENAARDIDRVRELLGEETINFLGLSYGTYVGALYANMFPDRVRAFVFDSVMTPNRKHMVDFTHRLSQANQAQLNAFSDQCGSDAGCAFHGGQGADSVESALDQLLADLEDSPLALEDGRTLTAMNARGGLGNAVRAGDFDALDAALAAAESGDGAPLMEQADTFWSRDDDGNYGAFFQAHVAIRIADAACPTDFTRSDIEDALATAESKAPVFGPLWLTLANACLTWPDIGEGTPDITSTDAPPMLLINARDDAFTPIAQAEAMQSTLDNGSHLLRWDGRGHGVLTRSTCALSAADAFFADPRKAPETTNCSN